MYTVQMCIYTARVRIIIEDDHIRTPLVTCSFSNRKKPQTQRRQSSVMANSGMSASGMMWTSRSLPTAYGGTFFAFKSCARAFLPVWRAKQSGRIHQRTLRSRTTCRINEIKEKIPDQQKLSEKQLNIHSGMI